MPVAPCPEGKLGEVRLVHVGHNTRASSGVSLAYRPRSFQVKNYADEFRNALEGKFQQLLVTKDDTVRLVAEEIEATTKEFILKRLSQELKGHPLAEFVAHLLGSMGYRTRVSPEGPDGGVDIIAHKDELGFEPPIIKVQVKSTEGNIGDPVVSSLYGKVATGEYGLLVTASIRKYQNRAIETTQVIIELIELAREISEAEKRGEKIGLTPDELAFYDALADNESAREVMGDDILKQIARDLTMAIRNNISVDWAIRDSVQAKMKMIIKRLLKKYGYPPDKTAKAVDVVMEQTKLMCQNESK